MKPSLLLAAAKGIPSIPALPKAPAHPFQPGKGAHPFVPSQKITDQFQPPAQVQRETPNLSPLQQFAAPTNTPGPTAFQRPDVGAFQPLVAGDKKRVSSKAPAVPV